MTTRIATKKSSIYPSVAYPYIVEFVYSMNAIGSDANAIKLEICNISTDETTYFHDDEAIQMFKLLTSFRNEEELKNYLVSLHC